MTEKDSWGDAEEGEGILHFCYVPNRFVTEVPKTIRHFAQTNIHFLLVVIPKTNPP